MKITDKLICAGLLPALMLGACARRDEATLGTPANPLVVVLSPAYAPSAAGAEATLKKLLEKASGMTIELKLAASQGDAIRAFGSDRTDAGLMTLEEYLVAREEYGVRPELQALRGKGEASYDGVLLTRSKGGAPSVAALAGKKVGFVGPYSVSGFVLPAIYLEEAGVKPVPEFSASHAENVARLLKGEVEAAATYGRQASRPGLKVLAVTGKVPNEPLVTRHDLPQDKREDLAEAFMALNSTAEGRRALASVADITGFRPADAAVYRPLHELLLSQGRPVYDLVPNGWEIYRLNQPYMPDR